VNCGGLSNFSSSRGFKLETQQRRIQGERISRITWSLSFEDLENLQFQGLLEDWWCCGLLGLKIRVVQEIICNYNNL